MVTHRRWRGGGAHEEVGGGFQGCKCGARSQARSMGALLHRCRQVARAPAEGAGPVEGVAGAVAPPAGVGIEMLPRGRGIKPIQKACGASARTLQLAAPYGRLHVTKPPLSVCVDASGERARPLSADCQVPHRPPGQEGLNLHELRVYVMSFAGLRGFDDTCMDIPFVDSPTETPYSRFHGEPPSVTHVRAFGCLAYPLLFHPATKMAERATRAICLGRAPDQSAYVVYCLSDGRIFATQHVRFVETEYPGVGAAMILW
eukprot:scaffold9112_cov139-Isochrysis_galbana.AAC.4